MAPKIDPPRIAQNESLSGLDKKAHSTASSREDFFMTTDDGEFHVWELKNYPALDAALNELNDAGELHLI